MSTVSLHQRLLGRLVFLDSLQDKTSREFSGITELIVIPFFYFQDPTDQTAIDNFMVHQLDGTQNEWGWCKQKVS